MDRVPPLPLVARPPKAEIVKRDRSGLLQPWMIPTFATAMRQGHTIASASDLLGVTARTVRKWLDRADEEGADDLHIEFAHAAREARGSVTSALVSAAMTHALVDPKICMELLKVHASDFNVARKVEAEVAVSPPKLDLSGFSPEEVRTFRELELKALAGPKG